MTACHFIAHLQFAFLGNIHLGHLHNSVWQVITNGSNKLSAVINTKDLLVLNDVVVDQRFNQFVYILVGCPLTRVNTQVINTHQHFLGEFDLFRYNLFLEIIVDTLRCFPRNQHCKLIYKFGFQFLRILCKFIIKHLHHVFFLGFHFAVLDHAREELLINDHSLHRRRRFK